MKRSIWMIGLLFLLTLPVMGKEQEKEEPGKKTYTCTSSSSRRGSARIGSGAGARNVGTIETKLDKTIRFLPCDVPDGITVQRFQGNARDGFDAVLATINKDLKKKKQLTLRVDPSVEEALSKRLTQYHTTSYRVDELLNFLCGGVCDWQFEEQEDSRVLALSPVPSATAAP